MTNDEIAIAIIEAMERAKLFMEQLRAGSAENKWNGRALSVAITELETSQLWLANARPE